MQRRPPRRPGGPRRRPQNNRPSAPRTEAPAAVATAPQAPVEIPPTVSVKDFADKAGISPSSVIRELLQNGIIASINQTIDYDTAAIVAADLGFEVKEMTFDL